jgi:hypothetical protein
MFSNPLIIPVSTVAAAALVLFACKDGPLTPSLEDVNPDAVVFLSDFNDENGGQGVFNWADFAEWNVVDGCVDLHGNGFIDVWPNNGLYVDLDGSCSQGGTLKTQEELVLTPGNYVLEFWLAGNNRRDDPDTVLVNFGAVHQEEIVMQRKDPFRLFQRNLTVSTQTSAKLSFQNLGGDNEGALLDLVRVRRVP